jgi:hypothetical protein
MSDLDTIISEYNTITNECDTIKNEISKLTEKLNEKTKKMEILKINMMRQSLTKIINEIDPSLNCVVDGIRGGQFADYGDMRINYDYEVAFSYYINNIRYSMSIKDNEIPYYSAPLGPLRRPAEIIVRNILEMDARNYKKLPREIYPFGDASYYGGAYDR